MLLYNALAEFLSGTESRYTNPQQMWKTAEGKDSASGFWEYGGGVVCVEEMATC